MKRIIAIVLTVCVLLIGIPCFTYAISLTPEVSFEEFSNDFSAIQKEYEGEPVSNRLIVKSKYDINELDSVDVVEGYNDLHILQFDDSDSASEALEYYKKNRLIEYAEKDSTISTMEISYPYGNHLSWGSDSIGVDDYFAYLENKESLPEIVVGIIDTGIDLDHEFLKDRIIKTNYNVSTSGDKYSEDDDQGHGTHVAGIVADNTTNNVKIKGFKCLNSNGSGSDLGVIMAIYAAIESHVDVINMSLGAQGNSASMEEAVNKAVENGITVCVAAGNNGNDAKGHYPANIDACITVGAFDVYNKAPIWTNWGDCVDIVAPGVSINSSWLGNDYSVKSGTSMASPFVSAASALLLSYNLNYTPSDIDELLKENGRVWTNNDNEYNSEKKALYIASIDEHQLLTRASKPMFNHYSGRYDGSFLLEMSTDEENAKIYYTLDGTSATDTTGMLYTEPILIDKPTTVHASVIVEGKYRSLQQIAQYYVTTLDSENLFEINREGIITAYYGNNNSLTIPDSINGITVIGIGERVFARSDIYIIKFPDTLTILEDEAFDQCSNLVSVYANNIEFVGDSGFDTCSRLLEIDLTNLAYVGKHAFDCCISLDSIYNEGLTEISEYAFCWMDGLVSATFKNANRIGTEALSGIGDMTAVFVDLPNVEMLELGALSYSMISEANFSNLKTLNTNESGVGAQFEGCPVLATASFPSYDESIPKRTFENCNNLENVYIPKASAIAESAFNCCEKLNVITIGSNLTSVGKGAFNNCIRISDVFFEGTKEEWRTIRIEDENDYLIKANIRYLITNHDGDYNHQWQIYSSQQKENDIIIVFVCDECSGYIPVGFSKHINTGYPLLDFVEDGIVNAKDYAYLLKNYSE